MIILLFFIKRKKYQYITDISTDEMLDDSNTRSLHYILQKKNESVWDIARVFQPIQSLLLTKNRLTSDIG